MKRVLVCTLAALAIGNAVPAAARDGFSPGAAAAVGALGGFALGAAIAAPRPVYAAPVAPVYAPPPPAYAEPVAPAYEEVCYTRPTRVWVPGWGWEYRRRTVCE